jgi:hypothetical protein
VKANLLWLLSATIGCASVFDGVTPDPDVEMSGERGRGMANCPSAVAGATTAVQRTEDGVTLTITAADPQARAQILARARRTVELGPPRGTSQHDGRGSGPETQGHCPMIVQGNVLGITELPDGARIDIRPRDRRQIGVVQARVEARLAGLREALPRG